MKFITKISKYIDYTLLKSSATEKEIKILCQEAIKYQFITVCVNPIHVPFCSKILSKSNIKICAVVGFPLGANKLNQKCLETSAAVNDGAEEIDMVMNIGSFKDGNYEYVLSEIQSVIFSAKNKIVKIIIETGLLNKDEIIKACNIVNDSDAQFIKTSTGFINGGNASIEDVEVIKQNILSKKKIKASGGIKTLLQLRNMLDAGADRIGTSSGVQIMKEIERNNS